MSLDTLERPETRRPDGDDAERRAHIVWDDDNAHAVVTEARVLGLEVEALCGYRWIPQRDPERFPLCETCAELAAELATS